MLLPDLCSQGHRLGSGIPHGAMETFTPYCLRRGEASWHFAKYANYDATQSLGRWVQLKTARLYIDHAAADLAECSLPQQGLLKIQRANEALPTIVRALLPTT